MSRDPESRPLLYGELASWWPLLSHPSEYAEEARFYYEALEDCCDVAPTSLLELGSGGGNNASHLKQWIDDLTLVDRSEGMLEVSRALNPGCEHLTGDMRTVRLEREFDCVFVHDAISHITSLDDLALTMETAHVHTRPGGCALFAPDHVRETFTPSTEHGGTDGPSRALRYLGWTWDPDPSDSHVRHDMAYLLREATGDVRVAHDYWFEGLFYREDWLRLLSAAAFEPRRLLIQHTELPGPLDVFVGRRPKGD